MPAPIRPMPANPTSAVRGLPLQELADEIARRAAIYQASSRPPPTALTVRSAEKLNPRGAHGARRQLLWILVQLLVSAPCGFFSVSKSARTAANPATVLHAKACRCQDRGIAPPSLSTAQ